MEKEILKFFQEFSFEVNFKISAEKVVYFGLGGSGLAGKIFIDCFREPQLILKQSLELSQQNYPHIFVSYSGKTKEIINLYLQAVKNKLVSVVITSGGELKNLALQFQSPLILLPSGTLPRLAVGYIFKTLVDLLTTQDLSYFQNFNSSMNQETAQKLADRFQNKKIFLIYSLPEYQSPAYFWKTNLNENTKVLSWFNFLPELNHNEIESFAGPFDFSEMAILFLVEKNSLYQKYIDWWQNFLKKKNIDFEIIYFEGENKIEKIFNNYLYSLWFSFYLAKEKNIDPAKTSLIEKLKNELK